MQKYIIAATGTDIGKTFVTCELIKQLQKRGKKVAALKPIISGFDSNDVENSDTGKLLLAQNLPLSQQNIVAISPWRFETPISPDMAAQDAGQNIDFEEVVKFCRKQSEHDFLFIETAGGIMTPLNSNHTFLDLCEELKFPLILVAGNYVGSISHTLTACNAIDNRNLKISSIIINESMESLVSPQKTIDTLQNFLPAKIKFSALKRDGELQIADIL